MKLEYLAESGQEGKMLMEYIQKALQRAQYKKLEDNTWFAEIPKFKGVWANGGTVEDCRKELTEVLEEWILLKVKDGDPFPVIDKTQIRVQEKIRV